MPEEDRDAILAGLRIAAVGTALTAGVFDGQTPEEIAQAIATMLHQRTAEVEQ
jgi:hypothetical protein